MGIRFKCGGCGAVLSVVDQLAGKQAKCGRCGRVVLVPAAQAKRLELLADLPDHTSLAADDPFAATLPANRPSKKGLVRFFQEHEVAVVLTGLAAFCLVMLVIALAVISGRRSRASEESISTARTPDLADRERPRSNQPGGRSAPAGADQPRQTPPPSAGRPASLPAMAPLSSGEQASGTSPSSGGGGRESFSGTELGHAEVLQWPEEDVPWAVEPDPAPPPTRPYHGTPIPIGVGAKRGEIVFARADVGRAAVFHRADADRIPAAKTAGNDDLYWLTHHDLYSGRLLGRIDFPTDGTLMAISPGGKLAALLVGRGTNSHLEVWSLDSRRCIARWRFDSAFAETDATAGEPCLRRHSELAHALFVDDEHLVLTGKDGVTALWKLPEGRAVYRLPQGINQGGCRGAPLITPGGRYLVGVQSGRLRFFDPLTGKVAGDAEGEVGSRGGHGPLNYAFSVDGRLLALAQPDYRYSELGVWDMASGEFVWYSCLADRMKPQLAWCGESRLLSFEGDDALLVDLDLGVSLCTASFSGGWLTGGQHGGGQWAVHEETPLLQSWLATVEGIGQTLAAQIKTPIPTQVPVLLGPGASVSLEVGAISGPGLPADMREKAQRHLHQQLESGGTQIEPGAAVKLVATCQCGQDGEEEFELSRFFGPSEPKKRVRVPIYTCRARLALLGQSGEVHWEATLDDDTASYFVMVEYIPAGEDPADYLRKKRLERRTSTVEEFFLQARLPSRMFSPLRTERGSGGLDFVHLVMDAVLRVPDLPQVFMDTEMVSLEKAPVGLLPQMIRSDIEDNYLEILAADDVLAERLRWCPAVKSPSIGLRCGLALETTGLTRKPSVFRLDHLQEHTGVIGPGLVQALCERVSDGRLGDWRQPVDPRTALAVYLGMGDRDDLMQLAKAHYVDLVALVSLTQKGQDILMRVRLITTVDGETRWVSASLSSQKVGAARQFGEDLLTPVLNEAIATIDADFVLAALPSLLPEHAKARLAALAGKASGSKSLEMLAALSEARYYQNKGLVTADEAATLFDAALGSGNGSRFAAATGPERRQMVRDRLDELAVRRR